MSDLRHSSGESYAVLIGILSIFLIARCLDVKAIAVMLDFGHLHALELLFDFLALEWWVA